MNKSESYQRGFAKMMEFTNTEIAGIPTHTQISEQLNALAPGLDDYIVGFAYGEIYTREGLDNKQRAMVTLASLVTLGTEPQFELHVNTALTAGLEPKQIIETVVHTIPYIGFPRVLNALAIIKKVLIQRGIELDQVQAEAKS